MTPRTGWRRPSPPGGTRSGSSRSTCAPSTPPRCAGCCRARSWCRTCSTSSTWRSRCGDVRRRVVRGKHGRRGRSGDPEYGVTGLLVRNLEHLSPEQFAKVTDALGRDPAGQEIAAARFGKEKLRHALNRPRHRLGPVRARRPRPALCLLRLVRAERRHPRAAVPGQDGIPVANEIVAALLTGITNFRFRKPEPARQTRSPPGIRVPQPGQPAQARPLPVHPRTRRRSRNATGRKTRLVTRRRHDPRLTSRSRIMPPGSHRLRSAARPGGLARLYRFKTNRMASDLVFMRSAAPRSSTR